MKLPRTKNLRGLRFGQLVYDAIYKKVFEEIGGTEKAGCIEEKLHHIPDSELEKLLTNYLKEK